MPDPNYEKMVNKLAFAAINEQRRARRWRIFFLFLFFAYLTPVLFVVLNMGDDGYSEANGEGDKQHTALVRLSGVIASDEDASAGNVIAGLKAAFSNENTKGVILEINSPGGSPVQSSYITMKFVAFASSMMPFRFMWWCPIWPHRVATLSQRPAIKFLSIDRVWSARSVFAWTTSDLSS